MQRFSGGLKVPLEMMEELPAQTSDGTGVIDYVLKYPPKSEEHIQVLMKNTGELNRQAQVISLTSGNHVWIRVWKFLSPGGGVECTTLAAINEAQGPLVINYEVS